MDRKLNEAPFSGFKKKRPSLCTGSALLNGFKIMAGLVAVINGILNDHVVTLGNGLQVTTTRVGD